MVDMDAPPDITNDPFKPPNAPPPTAVDAAIAGGPPKTGVATIGPAPVGPLQPTQMAAKGPGGVVISPAVQAVQPPPEVTLQGVVLAEHAVGVFRSGDQTFYKGIGDVVIGDMVLKLVADSGVVLASGKETFHT